MMRVIAPPEEQGIVSHPTADQPSESIARGCRFCTGITYADQATGDEWNIPIDSSARFVAVPSLGSLVEGWVLIVPRSHRLSMADLGDSEWEEFVPFLTKVKTRMQGIWGRIVAFEHGPGRPNSNVGCGVDHAHLHLVGISGDLLGGCVSQFKPKASWHSASDLNAIRNLAAKSSYLLLDQPETGIHLHVGAEIPSQFFRRRIAELIGESEFFDWKANSHLPNVRMTVSRYRAKS